MILLLKYNKNIKSKKRSPLLTHTKNNNPINVKNQVWLLFITHNKIKIKIIHESPKNVGLHIKLISMHTKRLPRNTPALLDWKIVYMTKREKM